MSFGDSEKSSQYIKILEKLSKDEDHHTAIKSINELLDNADSLNKIEKHQLEMLKVNSLIKIQDRPSALKLLEKIDQDDVNTKIATQKLKCLTNDDQLGDAVEISSKIMQSQDDWKNDIEFLLESSGTWLAYWSLSRNLSFEDCKNILEYFLFYALEKDPTNVKVHLEISEMFSMLSRSHAVDNQTEKSLNELAEIMNIDIEDKSIDDLQNEIEDKITKRNIEVEKYMSISFEHLKKIEDILKYNSPNDPIFAKLDSAYAVFCINVADLEKKKESPNQKTIKDYFWSAIEYYKLAIEIDPGNDSFWINKANCELELAGKQKDAFYSAIVALSLYDGQSKFADEAYSDLIEQFSDPNEKSQLLDILEKKKIRPFDDEDKPEFTKKEWSENVKPLLLDMLKENNVEPKGTHDCEILGIRLVYDLTKNFNCPAIHDCGFEYKP